MIDSRTGGRLALAAVASAAVHAAVIAVARIELPQRGPDAPPLAVRLSEAPAPTARKPAAPVPPRIARAPKTVALPATPSTAIVPREFPVPAVESGVIDAASAVEAAAPAEPLSSEPTVIAKAEPSTYVPEAPPLRTLPRRGRITYNLLYGRDGFPVGRTVQSWQIENGEYRLASASETTGIIDFFRSQHRNYVSRGSVTRDGLRPESFLMSRNRGRGLEEARAQFDWPDGTVTLGPATAQRRESLPAGAQDLVSFVYQLAIDPPRPGRLRLPVTNGTRLEIYELDVLPEESIETPLGTLRALPLRQVRSGTEESVEVWLATEYRYLPVRIRFFSRDGRPAGEQIVSEIRLSEE